MKIYVWAFGLLTCHYPFMTDLAATDSELLPTKVTTYSARKPSPEQP